MKLALQNFGHYAVLKVTESVEPGQFPALRAGILKLAQHDKIVGKVAIVVDFTAVDAAVGEKKESAAALSSLVSWAAETGIYLILVSAIPGLGQVPDLAQAQAKLDSPEGKQALLGFVAERETVGLTKQAEQGEQAINAHQQVRQRAATNRARAHQLEHAVRDVWKDRKPPLELPAYAKRMAVVQELIDKVPRK